MNQLWRLAGIAGFWLAWPALWVYLRISTRTRVLVVAEDHVLVVKPWLGARQWILPGGGMHWGEEPGAAAARELHEETGLTVPAAQLHALHKAVFTEHGFRFPYTCFVLELPARLPVRKQFWEVVDIAWLPIGKVDINRVGQDVSRALAAWRDSQNSVQ